MSAPTRSGQTGVTVATRAGDSPLSGIMSAKLFPDRKTLRIQEVADALQLTPQHVQHLIEEGRLVAVNTASGLQSTDNPRGNKTRRNWWRIPVGAYDQFILRNLS